MSALGACQVPSRASRRSTFRPCLLAFLVPLVGSTTHSVVKCPTGWGSSHQDLVNIPVSAINDGYCDCPTTGADEPGTEACSGMEAWPGTQASPGEARRLPMFFSCPQQKALRLPMSRVNDGICDCCDGADEVAIQHCPDRCEEMLRAEREAQQRLRLSFQRGQARRAAQVQQFAQLKETTLATMKKTKADLFFAQQELEKAKGMFDAYKLRVMDEWREKVLNRSVGLASIDPNTSGDGASFHATPVKGLLDGLTTDELTMFIVHACQLAGEMKDAADAMTCVPLRLAGLDVGLLWEAGQYEVKQVTWSSDKELRQTFADLFDYNRRQANDHMDDMIWNTQALQDVQREKSRQRQQERQARERNGRGSEDVKRGAKKNGYMMVDHSKVKYPKRRRLSEAMDDDEYDHSHTDDDISYDDEEDEDHDHSRNNNKRKASDADSSKRQEIEDMLKSRDFSKTRVSFLEGAAKLIQKIEQLQEAERQGDESSDEIESAETKEDSTPEQSAQFDPMALPMIRNALDQREQNIKRGLDYGVSAKVLLESLQTHLKDDVEKLNFFLMLLAVGTMNHGRLSVVNYWQIIEDVVQGITDGPVANDTQSCPSPWAKICPARSILRKQAEGIVVQIPPDEVIEEVEKFCQTTGQNPPPSGSCLAPDAEIELPSVLADGYFGYYSVEPRGSEDLFHQLFKDLVYEEPKELAKELSELTADVEKLEGDEEALEAELRHLEDLIGGADAARFGPNGELHALRDECFSVEAGKYTYEVCMFGAAKQKETGQAGSGTDLGQWTEDTIDESSGQRVWKWEKGAKCWNGPMRSATAYVTCGPETKALSADEPDPCRYVLHMESHIACDDAFRKKHGL